VGDVQGVHYYVMQLIAGLGLDEVLHDVKRIQDGKPPQARDDPRPTPAPRNPLTAATVAKWSVSQITSWLARSFILRSRSCEKMRRGAF
jgi:hypothetical protein